MKDDNISSSGKRVIRLNMTERASRGQEAGFDGGTPEGSGAATELKVTLPPSLKKKFAGLAQYKALSESIGGYLTPMEVMIYSMNHYFNRGRLREACEIAKDAAPFLHPKLMAVAVQEEVTVTSNVVTPLLRAEELKAMVRGVGCGVVKDVIDVEPIEHRDDDAT